MGSISDFLQSRAVLFILHSCFSVLGALYHSWPPACHNAPYEACSSFSLDSCQESLSHSACWTLSILHRSRRWPSSMICMKKLASRMNRPTVQVSTLLCGFLRDIFHHRSPLDCQTNLHHLSFVVHRLVQGLWARRYIAAILEAICRSFWCLEIPSTLSSPRDWALKECVPFVPDRADLNQASALRVWLPWHGTRASMC